MKENSSFLKTFQWEMLKGSDDEYDSDATCCETLDLQHQETRNVNATASMTNMHATPAPTSTTHVQENNTSSGDLLVVESSDSTNCLNQPYDKFQRESYFGFTDSTLSESVNKGGNHGFESDFNFTEIYEKEVQQSCNVPTENGAQCRSYFFAMDPTRAPEGNYLVGYNNEQNFTASLPPFACLKSRNMKSQAEFPLKKRILNAIHFSEEKENVKPDEMFYANLLRSEDNSSMNYPNLEQALYGTLVKNNSSESAKGEFDSSSESENEESRAIKLQIENLLKLSADNFQFGAAEEIPTIFYTTVNNEEINNNSLTQATLFEYNNGLPKNEEEDYLIGLTQNMNQIAECDPLIGSDSLAGVGRPCTPPINLNQGVRRKVLPADKKLPNYKRKHVEELRVLPARKCASTFVDPSHRGNSAEGVLTLETRCDENNSKSKTRKKPSENINTPQREKKTKLVQQKSSKRKRRKKKRIGTSILEVEPCKREVFYPEEELQKVEEFLGVIEELMTQWLSGSEEFDPPSRDQVFMWLNECQLRRRKLNEFKERIEKGRRYKNRKRLLIVEATLSERLNQLMTLIDKTISDCDQAVEQETQDNGESQEETDESSLECQSHNHSSSDGSQTEIPRCTRPILTVKYGPQRSTLGVTKPILKMSHTESSNSEENSAKEKRITFSDEIEYKFLSGSEQSSLRESQSSVVGKQEKVESKVMEKEMDHENSSLNDPETNILIRLDEDDKTNPLLQPLEEVTEESHLENPQCLSLSPSIKPNSDIHYKRWDFAEEREDTYENTTSDVHTDQNYCPDSAEVYSHNITDHSGLMQHTDLAIPPKDCSNHTLLNLHQTNWSNQGICTETPPVIPDIHGNQEETNFKYNKCIQMNTELQKLSDEEYISMTNINNNSKTVYLVPNDKPSHQKTFNNSECTTNKTQKYDLNSQPNNIIEKSSQLNSSEEMKNHVSWTSSGMLDLSSTQNKQECSTIHSSDAVQSTTSSQGDGFGFSEATPGTEYESMSVRDLILSVKSIRIKEPGEFMSVSEVDPDDWDDIDKWDD